MTGTSSELASASPRPPVGSIPPDPDPAPVAILDELTLPSTSYLFNTHSPPYRSSTARHLCSEFRWQSSVSPMIHNTELGLVLYDRVVNGPQEARMLQKLTKPKSGRPGFRAVSTVQYSGGAGAPVHRSRSPSPTHSRSPSPPPSPGRSTTHTSRPHATAQSATIKATRGAMSAGHDGSAGHSLHGGPQPRTQLSAQTSSGTHGGGVGGAGSNTRRPVGRRRYTAALKSNEDVEMEKASRNFAMQRATMTTTHVFTWGGRLSQRTTGERASRGPAGQRAAAAAGLTPVGGLFSGATHAPLRLDTYHD